MRVIRELADIQAVKAAIIQSFLVDRFALTRLAQLDQEELKRAVMAVDLEYFLINVPPLYDMARPDISIPRAMARRVAMFYGVEYVAGKGSSELFDGIVKKMRQEIEDRGI